MESCKVEVLAALVSNYADAGRLSYPTLSEYGLSSFTLIYIKQCNGVHQDTK